jgi:hypothetical protein
MGLQAHESVASIEAVFRRDAVSAVSTRLGPEQAAEKLVERVSKGCFVSGHDFSRAVKRRK